MSLPPPDERVGPVLQATPFGRLIVTAILDENDGVLVQDEGAYVRVLAPRVCRLSRHGLEAVTGSTVQFPGDLEVLMSSFAGRMQLTDHDAVWWMASESPPAPPYTKSPS